MLPFGLLAAQVIAIGLPWSLLHCAGMCGPLLHGCGVGCRAGAPTSRAVAGDLAAFQAGRALVLLPLGALGAMLAHSLTRHWPSAVLAVLVGVLLVGIAGWQLAPPRWRPPPLPGIAALARRASRAHAAHPLLAAVLLGVVVATLPCPVLLWALSVAGAAGTPLRGAALVGLFLLCTSLPLALATWLRVPLARRRWLPSWSVPVALAGTGVVAVALGLGAIAGIPWCPWCAIGHGG